MEMLVVTVVVSALLAAGLAASALAKITKSAAVIQNLDAARVPRELHPFLAGCEILGALGLMVGIAVPQFGWTAAGALIFYFLVAICAHLLNGDKNVVPAFAFLGLSILALILHVATA